MLKNVILFTLLCASCQLQAQDDAMVARGKVIDAITRKGIEADIRYSSIPTGSIFGHFQDSTFAFPIFGVVKYEITAEAHGYNSRTVILDPGQADDLRRVVRNIMLTPEGEAIPLSHLIFSQGKAQIHPQSYHELDEVVEMMKDNTRIVIRLEGHTDNLGDPKANFKLSQKRVDAVREYLVEKGISKNRVKTRAFGGTQMLIEDTNSGSRDANRRVELRILKS